MNWKKIGLFTLFLILGITLFSILTIYGGYTSLFLPMLFVVFVVLLVMIIKQYSRKKFFLIIILFVLYLLLQLVPFPRCDNWGYFGSYTQECTCIGIEKHSFGVFDASWSQCVGVPLEYRYYEWDMMTGKGKEIPKPIK
jgi:hypothetical protein